MKRALCVGVVSAAVRGAGLGDMGGVGLNIGLGESQGLGHIWSGRGGARLGKRQVIELGCRWCCLGWCVYN